MISISPLKAGDIDNITRLFHRLWHATQASLQDPRMARHRDLGFFRKRVVERANRTIVAKADSELAGFATWTGGTLNSLFVADMFQGRSIGAALCAAVETRMAEAGAPTFELHCIEGNHRARAFYESRGWRVDRLQSIDSETPEGLCHVSTWLMVKP